MNTSTWVTACLLIFILLAIGFYERKKLHARELAVIVSMAALAGISRVPFVGLPSVQPTTFLVLYSGFVFGPLMGCAIGACAAWISNFFLLQGQGPWTIWQMLAWGLVGLTSGFVGQRWLKSPKFILLLLSVGWGFLFGWIMNFWVWVTFSYPLNWQTWIAVNAASVLFDLTHAVNNVLFAILFGKPLLAILKRYRHKLEIVHVRP